MDYGHKWVGDSDMRIHFDNKYISLFENVYDRKNAKDINFKKYDITITDDNRDRNGLPKIYTEQDGRMIGCSHGNATVKYFERNHKKSFDKCFVFGNKERETFTIPAGIPANDKLKDYENTDKKHILIIFSN